MTTTVKMLMKSFANTPFGMFSTIQCGDAQLYTLEHEWHDTEGHINCLPGGIYKIARLTNPEPNREFMVLSGTEERCPIITKGNVLAHVEGNILVGEDLSCVDNRWAIEYSGVALAIFKLWMDGVNEAELYIDRSIIGQHYNNAR